MRRDERRKEILDLLVKQGSVKLDELAPHFGVSKMTIHRDLDELEGEGILRKTRGGASIESSMDFEADYRFREHRDTREKSMVARAALALIEPGMSVILNDGTTAALLGELLPAKRPLTVITNNLGVIEAVKSVPGLSLVVIGGNYSQKFNGFFGIVAEEGLRKLRADVSFISAPAINNQKVFHMDHEALRIKRLMIEVAQQSYLMADHRKFGRTALNELVPLDVFTGVITDAGVESALVEELKSAGIELIVAS